MFYQYQVSSQWFCEHLRAKGLYPHDDCGHCAPIVPENTFMATVSGVLGTGGNPNLPSLTLCERNSVQYTVSPPLRLLVAGTFGFWSFLVAVVAICLTGLFSKGRCGWGNDVQEDSGNRKPLLLDVAPAGENSSTNRISALVSERLPTSAPALPRTSAGRSTSSGGMIASSDRADAVVPAVAPAARGGGHPRPAWTTTQPHQDRGRADRPAAPRTDAPRTASGRVAEVLPPRPQRPVHQQLPGARAPAAGVVPPYHNGPPGQNGQPQVQRVAVGRRQFRVGEADPRPASGDAGGGLRAGSTTQHPQGGVEAYSRPPRHPTEPGHRDRRVEEAWIRERGGDIEAFRAGRPPFEPGRTGGRPGGGSTGAAARALAGALAVGAPERAAQAARRELLQNQPANRGIHQQHVGGQPQGQNRAGVYGGGGRRRGSQGSLGVGETEEDPSSGGSPVSGRPLAFREGRQGGRNR